MPKDFIEEAVSKIELAYPEAYRLARLFHALYEEYAPKFGYNTNEKTKEFDPSSPNGRLMAYVCYNLVNDELEAHREQVIGECKKLAIKKWTFDSSQQPTHTWHDLQDFLQALEAQKK